MPDAVANPQSDLGALPEWNLDDLYSGPDCAELRQDLDAAAGNAKAFNERYQGKVGALSGDELGEAVAAFEAQHDGIGRISSYAQLLHAGHVGDPAISRFFQDTNERVTDITAELIFFTLALNRIDDEGLQERLALEQQESRQQRFRAVANCPDSGNVPDHAGVVGREFNGI